MEFAKKVVQNEMIANQMNGVLVPKTSKEKDKVLVFDWSPRRENDVMDSLFVVVTSTALEALLSSVVSKIVQDKSNVLQITIAMILKILKAKFSTLLVFTVFPQEVFVMQPPDA